MPTPSTVTASVDMHILVSRLCDALAAEPNLIVDYRALLSTATIPGSAEQASKDEPVEAGWRSRCRVVRVGKGNAEYAYQWAVFHGLFTLGSAGKDWYVQSEKTMAIGNFLTESEARAALAKAQPPPDHIGDTTEMVPAPFEPLPEGWRPEGIARSQSQADALWSSPVPLDRNTLAIALSARDRLWLRAVNNLHRELHDLKGRS